MKKNKITELRVKIDGLAQLTKELKPLYKSCCVNNIDNHLKNNINSKETSKTYDSLIFAKAWLGKMLGELEVESPYPKDGTRKDVKDIEPTADVAKNLTINVDGGWEELNYIQKIDWLRQEILKTTLDIKILDNNTSNHPLYKTTREFAITRTNAYNYACEARMWLGFELQRLKENN